MKRKSFPVALLAVLTTLLCGCGQCPKESFVRSDYYTRGIGLYPGSPAEDPSPLAGSDIRIRT